MAEESGPGNHSLPVRDGDLSTTSGISNVISDTADWPGWGGAGYLTSLEWGFPSHYDPPARGTDTPHVRHSAETT